MKILKKLLDKCYIKQWNIGLVKADIKQILTSGNQGINYKWLPTIKSTRFYADPFIFRNEAGQLHLVYEDFTYSDQYGKISLTTLDENFNPLHTSEILDTHSHLSYPSVYKDGDKTYIIPEASKGGHLFCYEFDFASRKLMNRKMIMENTPLLDSTILFHENKYWLFATHRGVDSNNKLYIYHAHHWAGPYTPHLANPVKNTKDGTRPAGNFIKVDGEIYRPTQNCGKYYGKSICINKIKTLNDEAFEEEPFLELKPPKNTNFNYAIHTINFSDDVIVIDGLKRSFLPFEQLKIFITKKLKLTHIIYPIFNLYTTNEHFIPQVTMYMEC